MSEVSVVVQKVSHGKSPFLLGKPSIDGPSIPWGVAGSPGHPSYCVMFNQGTHGDKGYVGCVPQDVQEPRALIYLTNRSEDVASFELR